MTLIKSLLLGSAAGLAVVSGASAADLPVRKAAPVEYVRVCNTYGAGFFYIPGTDTCLSINGRVRADYLYGTQRAVFIGGGLVPGRAFDSVGFRARGRIQLDARTATAYGLLRTVVRAEITRSSGSTFGVAGIGTAPDIAQAFVQFGGLTAGRVTTFFDNGDLPTEHFGTLRFSDAPDVNVLAYTFTFGNGFSATLGIEDGIERRQTILGFTPGGQRMPDIVGNLKYSATWGTAQLSAAMHQIRTVEPLASGSFDTQYGFAVQGNVGVNLPMLGAGDALWLNVVYTEGALGYITGSTGDSFATGVLGGNASFLVADAYIQDGKFTLGRGGSVAGGLRHYWTPEVRQSVFGSYASFSAIDGVGGTQNLQEYRIGTNVIWQPVTGLDLGVEAIYINLDPKRSVATPTGLTSNDSAWEGRLRVQRDF